jgi:hypothetical protein
MPQFRHLVVVVLNFLREFRKRHLKGECTRRHRNYGADELYDTYRQEHTMPPPRRRDIFVVLCTRSRAILELLQMHRFLFASAVTFNLLTACGNQWLLRNTGCQMPIAQSHWPAVSSKKFLLAFCTGVMMTIATLPSALRPRSAPPSSSSPVLPRVRRWWDGDHSYSSWTLK